MALRLRVVGEHAARLGDLAHATFGVNGGRIGRALDNDWVLPDVDRYVSGHHAEIHYRSGDWVLRDLSTNGTYINDRVKPLGPGGTYVLKQGDRLQIGQFKMQVEVSGSNDFPPDEVEHDHGETLGVPLDEVLPTAAGEPRPAPQRVDVEPPRQARPEPPRPQRGAGKDELELLPGLAALCRGAGLDPAALPPGTRAMVLHQAGQVLRELLLGLLEMQRSRADFTREFGIAPPDKYSSGTSPLVRLTGVEDLLLRWLSQAGTSARPVDEVREMFDDARTHERAVSMAVRAGLEGLVGRLDPERFDRTHMQTAYDSPEARERLWLRYREIFRSATQPEQTGVPGAFADEFGRTYRVTVHAEGEPEKSEE